MPILNIELIKKAVKKISKIKENVVIKKGQSYIIGNHSVVVKSFQGGNIHVNIINSSGLSMTANEVVTSKENLIKAIQTKTLEPIKTRSADNILRKRLVEINDRSLEEAIANSPTVSSNIKVSRRGNESWQITTDPFPAM